MNMGFSCTRILSAKFNDKDELNCGECAIDEIMRLYR